MSLPSSARLLFVVDRPELNGGNKQIAMVAEALAQEGFDAAVAAHGPRPSWMDYSGAYYDAETDALDRAGDFDLAIYTYVFSYRLRDRISSRRVAHFCQGYEGYAPHLGPFKDEIEHFYRAIPETICVSEDLAALCRDRFGKRCAILAPMVEDRFQPADRPPPGRVKRLLIPGIFEMYTKGVELALDVAREVAARNQVEVVRLSTFPQSDAEREGWAPSRFLSGEPPAAVAEAMRSVDLTLTLPTGEEGFGLPALESLASGVPVVCSETSAYRSILAAGGARTASPPTVASYANLALTILNDPDVWRDMRRRGLADAAGYRLGARRDVIRSIFNRILGGPGDIR